MECERENLIIIWNKRDKSQGLKTLAHFIVQEYLRKDREKGEKQKEEGDNGPRKSD